MVQIVAWLTLLSTIAICGKKKKWGKRADALITDPIPSDAADQVGITEELMNVSSGAGYNRLLSRVLSAKVNTMLGGDLATKRTTASSRRDTRVSMYEDHSPEKVTLAKEEPQTDTLYIQKKSGPINAFTGTLD